MIYVFPAVFTPCDEGGYSIHFPDLPGTNSEGNDMADAIYMARDALAMWLDNLMDEGKEIPKASVPGDIVLEFGQFVTMIDVDLTAYRRYKESKAVKKTVTIPAWLNEDAEAHKVNFSAILQEGLKNHLGLENYRTRKRSYQTARSDISSAGIAASTLNFHSKEMIAMPGGKKVTGEKAGSNAGKILRKPSSSK